MRAEGVKARDVAEATGLSLNIIYEYTHGRYLPQLDAAQRVADALMAPELVQIVKQDRYKRCELTSCRRPFWRTGPQKFCSSECTTLAAKGLTRDAPHPALDAIDEMCRSCEPEGVCRNDGCPLRSFSTMPYAPVVKVEYIGDHERAARRANWRAKWWRQQSKSDTSGFRPNTSDLDTGVVQAPLPRSAHESTRAS